MEDQDYDVFIAGSGPTAATYARVVLEHDPNARILMVEVGSQDSPKIGMNLKNAVKYQRDLDAFMHIIRAALQPISIAPASGFLHNIQGDVWSQPGNRSSIRSPYNPDQDPTLNFESAGITRAVGGMVTHWTCACPEPHDEELELSPIPRPTMHKLLQQGKRLLNVHEDQFETSVRHQLVKKALGDAFECRDGITVKSLPIAGERSKFNNKLTNWSGVDTVLGDFIHAKDRYGRDRFKLLSECLVVKFILDPNNENRVRGALVRDLRTEYEYEISAKTFVAACGAIATPQLLWNSDIRHKALGRYLTAHSTTFCQVMLRKTLIDSLRPHQPMAALGDLPIPIDDAEPQISIPYSPLHPYHTQFHRDSFSYGGVGPQIDQRVVVDIRYFGKLEVQESNHVSFSYTDKKGGENTDIYGMPQPTIVFRTTQKDNDAAQRMMREMGEAANVLGSFLPSSPPQFIPYGFHAAVCTPLLYTPLLQSNLAINEGTTRIGNDPVTSVANASSRVRKPSSECDSDVFENLWVAGMNCIPDATACNPTLTGVAYAIQGANDLIAVLAGEHR